jgi:gamma-glutamyltranspeptidase/glutathione hydrolase
MILAGGNAVDAAVAAAAAVGIVEPFDSNFLGGESYILFWNNKKKQLIAVEATGYAPSTASLEQYRKLGGIPYYGPRSVIVPGSFDGWALLLADCGNLRLTQVLEPAIELAEKGFPVSRKLHSSMNQFQQELLKLPSSNQIYLKQEKRNLRSS